MADTSVQVAVEDWVRKTWMPNEFGLRFSRERVSLSAGGKFDFDAVSDDGQVVASISTSGAKTKTGKHAVGKLHKIRSDMLFLLMANTKRRMLVFTEQDMHDCLVKERRIGRVPQDIEFWYARIPSELDAELRKARSIASDEMSPA